MSNVDVNTANPLLAPYRTGTYLVSDAGPDNFRDAMTLTDHPYRASGSHQLGISGWARVLEPVVSAYEPRTLWLVDLREETHGYFNSAPVSWYADNDFSNVGQDRSWIVKHEKAMIELHAGTYTNLFTIADDEGDDLKQERVLPTSYTELWVGSARTEAEVAEVLEDVFEPTKVKYVRIPVTDHCAPTRSAFSSLEELFREVRGDDEWVHFHCHGGDGRTTSFLAMYDMWRWAVSRETLPTLEEFSARQCDLFSYCLNPAGGLDGQDCGNPPKPWQLPLAEMRWTALSDFLERLKAR